MFVKIKVFLFCLILVNIYHIIEHSESKFLFAQKFIKPKDRVLEIGAGYGYFSKLPQLFGSSILMSKPFNMAALNNSFIPTILRMI